MSATCSGRLRRPPDSGALRGESTPFYLYDRVREVSEIVLVAEPPVGAPRKPARQRPQPGPAATGRSPRLLELLRLAETQPSAPELQLYLTDRDPRIRRAAIGILTVGRRSPFTDLHEDVRQSVARMRG